MRDDSLGQEPIEYTEEQIKILQHYYFENQLRQQRLD
jgi:hypothetical protein